MKKQLYAIEALPPDGELRWASPMIESRLFEEKRQRQEHWLVDSHGNIFDAHIPPGQQGSETIMVHLFPRQGIPLRGHVNLERPATKVTLSRSIHGPPKWFYGDL
jgi:hypothetical protein